MLDGDLTMSSHKVNCPPIVGNLSKIRTQCRRRLDPFFCSENIFNTGLKVNGM